MAPHCLSIKSGFLSLIFNIWKDSPSNSPTLSFTALLYSHSWKLSLHNTTPNIQYTNTQYSAPKAAFHKPCNNLGPLVHTRVISHSLEHGMDLAVYLKWTQHSKIYGVHLRVWVIKDYGFCFGFSFAHDTLAFLCWWSKQPGCKRPEESSDQ